MVEILPGSLYTWLGDSEAHEPVKAYITAEMLEQLQKDGLELCGDSFTVTAVKVLNDGFVMPEGAIRGGYCWIDGWKTLELCKAAFNNYTNQRYLDIHFAADKGRFHQLCGERDDSIRQRCRQVEQRRQSDPRQPCGYPRP